MSANSRAKCNDETDGMVKVLTDKKTDKMLGCYMINKVQSYLHVASIPCLDTV
jgi:dihydrolipoamide dehydrogenase